MLPFNLQLPFAKVEDIRKLFYRIILSTVDYAEPMKLGDLSKKYSM